jgi:hypothetical protein
MLLVCEVEFALKIFLTWFTKNRIFCWFQISRCWLKKMFRKKVKGKNLEKRRENVQMCKKTFLNTLSEKFKLIFLPISVILHLTLIQEPSVHSAQPHCLV